MALTYVGVDNGVTGALAAVSEHPNVPIISMLSMPILRARKGKEIDIAAVWQWISTLGTRDQLTVILEEPGGSKSASAAASMSGSFHALRSMCVMQNLRWHRITPQSWQKIMLPGCKTGDSKPRALTLAKQLWPTETWLPTPKCRVPDDGLIDAALIAEFGRKTRL